MGKTKDVFKFVLDKPTDIEVNTADYKSAYLREVIKDKDAALLKCRGRDREFEKTFLLELASTHERATEHLFAVAPILDGYGQNGKSSLKAARELFFVSKNQFVKYCASVMYSTVAANSVLNKTMTHLTSTLQKSLEEENKKFVDSLKSSNKGKNNDKRNNNQRGTRAGFSHRNIIIQ